MSRFPASASGKRDGGMSDAEPAACAPAPAGQSSGSAAFWICCRFAQLPLDALGAGLPADQPFALIDTRSDREGRRGGTRARSVLAANAHAEALGVRAGMSLNSAYGLCPNLRCHGREPEAEARRLRQLADTAYGFTPNVSLLPPDALLLECAGTLRLFEGAGRLLQRLDDTWRALGHACEFGIGHTPLAATILARARRRLTPDPAAVPEPYPHEAGASAPRPSAPRESVQSPGGGSLAARTRQALEQVHLRHLAGQPWAPGLIGQFAASGIDTLGAVLALPRPAVGRRFGKTVLADLARMLGERPDPRAWIRPQPDFDVHLNLLDTLRQRAGLVFPMHRLLRELSVWLRARQLLTTGIAWRFIDAARHPAGVASRSRSAGSGDACIEVRLATPGTDDRRLLALTELQLERTTLPEEIGGIALRATSLSALASQATSLSLFRAPHEKRPPEELLDLVRARLGAAALNGLTLGDDHRPEEAWLPVAAPGVGRTGETSPVTSPIPSPGAHRPLWLLEAPRALEGQRFELLRGPERIESAWWVLEVGETRPAPSGTVHPVAAAPGATVPDTTALETRGARRDYYVARSPRGELCWIFRRHGDGAWFLHGYFG